MDTVFEIQRRPFGHIIIQNKDCADVAFNTLSLHRTQVSDLIHQLMFYLPEEERP